MLGPFRPSETLLARAARKLKLTTKQTNKGYYKGTRSGNVGHFSYNPKRYYIYEIDYDKVRTFVKPAALEECQVCIWFLVFIYESKGGI
jgi:large subunit ribosomal protein L41